jgi:chemosensory pili system protein ChpA (sensor histidine kinase/response regulator)
MTTDDAGHGLAGDSAASLEPFLREAPGVVEAIAEGVEALGGVGEGAALASLAVLCHRLYGSSSLYGLGAIAALSGAMERAVAGLAVADGAPAGRGRSALREGVASLRDALARASRDGASGAAAVAEELLARLADLAPPPPAADPLAARLRATAVANSDVLEFFEPEAREQLEGIAAALSQLATSRPGRQPIDTAFRFVHTLKGAAYMVECEPIAALVHAMEDLLAPAREGRFELRGPALEALEDATEVVQRMLAALAGEPVEVSSAEREVRARLAALHPAAAAVEPTPEVFAGAATPPPAAGRAASSQTIRVDLDRIDVLVDQVGEAMVSRGRLEHQLQLLGDIERLFAVSRDRVGRAAAELERRHLDQGLREAEADRSAAIVSELPLDGFSELELDRYDELDVVMRQIAEISFDLGETQSLLSALRRGLSDEVARSAAALRALRAAVGRTRMLPLGRLFERFRRRVESAARDRGKRVSLEVTGEKVEVDTAIVQRIGEPLLHLVTNAVTHGIESREERLAAGKPEQGTVSLRAIVRGVFVDLEIEDDGRGLDADALRRRAVDLDLLTAAEAERMSEAEALELIFQPGFSTVEEVTGAAGRGIGMDVVRTVVSELGGQVRTETVPGSGTRFTLRLPVTLVVSTGLKIRVASESFVLPTLNVRRLLSARAGELESRDGREWLSLDGERVEVIRLARLFTLPADPPGDALPLAVVQTPGRSLALAVDELVGIEEVVVQGLGGFLAGLAGFSGVTMSPDGAVVLVLDPASLPDLVLDSSRRPGLAGAIAEDRRLRDEAARPRVLLADDSVSVRKILGRQLTAAGYDVVAAHDGEEALKALRERPVAALITDIEMPRLNGFELLEIVRRRPATRTLPAIVITTRTGGKHRELANRLGASAYFSKPIDFEALLAVLAEVTSKRRPGAPTDDRLGSAQGQGIS